ncbi:MAG TPA: GntR family transcriptional regulator [Firmicutes bacterium]|nr:GntR family transcriptional regulator [Bacillota bacterium]
MIDPSSIIPLYHQLKEILREKVESGEWRPHQLIPSEPRLAMEYGVSRATARRAIEDLTREGLFYRKQGKGTFVNSPKIEQGLERFYSFSKDMETKGLNPGTEVLHLKEVAPNAKIRTQLQLSEGANVFEIQRLRLVKSEPVILETSWLPADLFPGLTLEALERNSLYDLMEKIYGIRPVRAEEYFEPVCVDDYESEMLGVKEGSPALLLHRIAYSESGRPVEVCKGIVRGDKCRYYVKLA